MIHEVLCTTKKNNSCNPYCTCIYHSRSLPRSSSWWEEPVGEATSSLGGAVVVCVGGESIVAEVEEEERC